MNPTAELNLMPQAPFTHRPNISNGMRFEDLEPKYQNH